MLPPAWLAPVRGSLVRGLRACNSQLHYWLGGLLHEYCQVA